MIPEHTNPLRGRLAARGRLRKATAPDCGHRTGFDRVTPVNLPSGRTAYAGTCRGCGRGLFVLRGGKTARKLEGVKVTLYRRDREPGQDGRQDTRDVSGLGHTRTIGGQDGAA